MAKQTAKQESNTPSPPSEAAYETIFQWFENYVAKNDIKIGGSLPSEDHIMAETQMSRSSVREAITRLRALGIVDSRRKRGMWLVRSPRLLDLVRLLTSTRIPNEQMGHVGGYRCALELGFWSEIFANAHDSDIAELRTIYEEMVAKRDNPAGWNDCDRRFHLKLIACTQNNVAIWMSELLNPFFETLATYLTPMPEYTRVLHESIVVSLEHRNAEAFYHALHEHNFSKLSANRHAWTRPQVVYNTIRH